MTKILYYYIWEKKNHLCIYFLYIEKYYWFKLRHEEIICHDHKKHLKIKIIYVAIIIEWPNFAPDLISLMYTVSSIWPLTEGGKVKRIY